MFISPAKESVQVTIGRDQITCRTVFQAVHDSIRQRSESVIAKRHILGLRHHLSRAKELKVNLFRRLTSQIVSDKETQLLAVLTQGDGKGLLCPFRLRGHLSVPCREYVVSVIAFQ